MWLLMSPDQYFRLAHRRRWPAQKYQRWLTDTITRLLLPPGTPEIPVPADVRSSKET